MRNFKKGFTLIELTIVVGIIGILAAIAIPQYQNLIVKSQEATSKGNLGVIRSALSVYYGDLDGNYPMDAANLVSLTAGEKYLQAIPAILLPITSNSAGHSPSNSVETTGVDDSGGLYYNNGGLDQVLWGQVLVNCTHQDLHGTVWSTY